MLSPLLFNVRFAAAFNVVLVRFRNHEGIVLNLVHLDGDRTGGQEEYLSACGGLCGACYTPATLEFS